MSINIHAVNIHVDSTHVDNIDDWPYMLSAHVPSTCVSSSSMLSTDALSTSATMRHMCGVIAASTREPLCQ